MNSVTAHDPDQEDAIAVVGIGGAVPGAATPERIWEALRRGEPVFREPRRFDISPFFSAEPRPNGRTYSRVAGFLDGLCPAPQLSREIRDGAWSEDAYLAVTLLRHSAHQALSAVHRSEGDRWSSTVAYCSEIGMSHLDGPLTAAAYLRMLTASVSDRPDGSWLVEQARHALALRHPAGAVGGTHALAPLCVQDALRGLVPEVGETAVVDAACSSGLHALDTAVRSLREGSCDIALCAASVLIAPVLLMLFCETGAITHRGQVRVFDEDTDGTMVGEGSTALVLKRLSRAQRDGDEIHGLILGTGLSSDGRQSSVHAPSVAGQTAALERAWRDAGVTGDDLDWVIGHGTGTVVGDQVELDSLRGLLGQGAHPCAVTSNKAVFGHTSANAGLLSVLNALLALKHQTIPGQPSFSRMRLPTAGDPGRLVVPTTEQPWPRGTGRPRLVGVSAFGLGGTNGHAVIAGPEYAIGPEHGGAPHRTVPPEEDMVVVAASARFPDSDEEDVREWLRGSGAPPPADFGPTYPLPSPAQVHIPPVTMRHMDRSQLMAIEATRTLIPHLGPAWEKLRPATGVIATGSPSPRHAATMAMRMHLPECAEALSVLPDRDLSRTVHALITEQVEATVPEVNPDDFTGGSSSVTSGRVANHFDLHGPNIVVHGGADGGLTALRAAQRWLRHGVCDLALVCGVSGNTLPEWQALLSDALADGHTLAEGAAVLALTLRTTAEAHGLEVLGTVDATADATAATTGTEALAGSVRAATTPPLRDARRSYWGADAVLAVLHAQTMGHELHLRPEGPGVPSVVFTPPASLADTPTDTHTDAQEPDEEHTGRAMGLRMVEQPAPPPVRQSGPAIPPRTVVVTDDDALAAAVATEPDTVLWAPATGATPSGAAAVPAERAAEKLATLAFTPEHVRVLTRLAPGDLADPARAEALHDLAFATVGALAERLKEAGGSVAALVMDGVADGVPHPVAGLLCGTLRSVRTELPSTWCMTVLVDGVTEPRALQLLAEESRHAPPGCLVAHTDGRRLVPGLVPAATTGPQPPLDRDSVIVATGGARGITPEILADLAERYTPEIYVLGRTTLPEADQPLPERQQFISRRRAEDPKLTIRDINSEYERGRRGAEVRRNLARLEALTGSGRVHYTSCDVTDAEQVRAALAPVIDRHGRVDLLIHAAMELHSQALPDKAVHDFQRVRAVKTRGYLNLKAALADCPPRTWCNFSSAGMLVGTPGDADYVAANEFLASASRWQGTDTGTGTDTGREFSILWSAWSEVGAAAQPMYTSNVKSLGWSAFITPAEGCRQLRRALTHHPDEPVLVFLRDAEQTTLNGTDGIGADRSSPAATSRPQGQGQGQGHPLSGDELNRRPGAVVHARVFPEPEEMAAQDLWIPHHGVNGRPVLPGMFALEMAAEAACALQPALEVVGFRDLRCQAPLFTRPSGITATAKTEATLLPGENSGEVTVRVRVLVDRVLPSGDALQTDAVCHEVDVVMARHYPSLPLSGTDGLATGQPRTGHPYHRPNPLIQLSGPFTSTTGYRSGPSGACARFELDLTEWEETFDRFRIPSLLLDSLAQVPALNQPSARTPLAALAGCDAVDLGTDLNDAGIARTYGQETMLYAPREGALYAAAEGTVLARVCGLRGAVLGHLDAATGEFEVATGVASPSVNLTGPETADAE